MAPDDALVQLVYAAGAGVLVGAFIVLMSVLTR
jgi:hypothetical protein